MDIKNFFDTTSFSFLRDLYRMRLKAEAQKDLPALLLLKERFPELFSDEGENFIAGIKAITFVLDQKYGQNFSSMLEVSASAEKMIKH